MKPEQAQILLNTLLQNLPDTFALYFDKDFRYIEVQGGGLERDGITPRESVLGRTLWEAMPSLMIQAVEPGYRAVFAGERSQVDLPYDGNIYEITMAPARDGSGSIVAGISVIRDVTAQRNMEHLLQIIAGQEAALRELSTPLIPLADNVVVMPIIGTIDARRAQQIMETLLEGVAANQADVALLDISGVRVVDTQVADALLRVAQAAKLLGTQIVLTGIRAEVAQTIVHLGADMTGIVTRSNLQDGLRYALAMVGADMAKASAFAKGTGTR
ncbi:MAG: STAS domain-containing protein [Chloroflexales bacterium]